MIFLVLLYEFVQCINKFELLITQVMGTRTSWKKSLKHHVLVTCIICYQCLGHKECHSNENAKVA